MKMFSSGNKMLSLTLSLVLLISLLPISSFSSPTLAAADSAMQGGKRFEQVRNELIEYRTETTKTFANPDGSYTTEIAETPLHYRNESGTWAPINNTLVPDVATNTLVNKSNAYQVFFQKQNLQQQLVKVNMNNMSVSMEPARTTDGLTTGYAVKQSASHAKSHGNQVIYPDLYDGVDLRYSLGNRKIKEDIILKNKPTSTTPTQFSFQLNMKGLDVTQDADGRIFLKNSKTGETVFFIDLPYMYDSNVPSGYKKLVNTEDAPEGAISYDVEMKLIQRGENYHIDLIPDRAWLESSERVYPVVIDPTLIRFQPGSSGIDTNLRSWYPTKTGGTDTGLGVGLYKDATQSNVIRSLLKFDISSIPEGALILNSKLNLWLSSVSNDTSIDVTAHKMSHSWTENGANWNTYDGYYSWKTKGGDFVSTPADTVGGISSLTDLSINYKWDMTDLVKSWKGGAANYGILLKSSAEGTATYKKFISSDDAYNPNNHPLLAVTYYPASRLGIEDHWTYDVTELVGGKSYTNITTGNNIVQFGDLALKGRGGLGMAFVRTYNSKSVDDSPLGYGWTFTGRESILESREQNKLIYTDADGTAHTFSYDAATNTYTPPAGTYFKMVRTTDYRGWFNGYELTYKNGLAFRFDKEQDYELNVTTGKLLWIQDRNGNRINYGYNTAGQLTTITDPSGRQVNLSYFTSGRIASITDYAGRKTTYGYDANGNLSSVHAYVNATNYRRTQLVYDDNHRLLTVIDPKGRKTDFTYTNELLVKVQKPYGEGTEADLSTRPGTVYAYDLANYTATATNRNGYTTTFFSNPDYVVTKMVDPLNRAVSIEMDADYNPIKLIDAKGHIYTNTFDSNGNLTKTLDSMGNTTLSTYDAHNNITSRTDELGKKTTYTYNSAGNLLSITRPMLEKITYEYDTYGNRTASIDANNNRTTYTYDTNVVNMTKLTNPAGQVTTLTYDSADRITSIIDPNGHVTYKQYNWLNELENLEKKESVSDAAPQIALDPKYDSNGNTMSISDTVNTVNKVTDYDHTGTNKIKLQQTVGAVEPQVQYGYDANENLTSWQPNDLSWGRNLQFAYDGADQLLEVKDMASQAVIANYGYDNNGNLTSMQRTSQADGILLTNEYDSVNRLTNIQYTKNGVTVAGYAYTFDAGGRIVSAADHTGAKSTYTYDDNGRLQGYSDSTGTTLYTYDASGNRVSKQAPNGSTTYTYNDLNQLITRSGADGSLSYLYNPKGELTDKGTTHLDWNIDGKIIKVINENGNMVEFVYNAIGQRIEKIVKDQTGTITRHLRYQYEDATGQLISETDLITNLTISYAYDAYGMRLSQSQKGNTYYYVYDAHGSVSGLTDNSGQFVVQYQYDPWGNLLNKTGTLANPFTYSGYYYDEETKLYYLINRYYDPQDGRYLSRDAYESDFGNLYLYTGNDPVNYDDPDGNFRILIRAFFKWIFKSGSKIVFKYDDKIAKQMGKRGWTDDLIEDTLNKPHKTKAWTDTRHQKDGTKKNEPATAYIRKDGSYVVRNNNTGEIVQISNRNDPNWIAPWD